MTSLNQDKENGRTRDLPVREESTGQLMGRAKHREECFLEIEIVNQRNEPTKRSHSGVDGEG